MPAMIVLISDGARTVGRSQVAAAEAAKDQGVPVYTVALGTDPGRSPAAARPCRCRSRSSNCRRSPTSRGQGLHRPSPDDLVSAYQDVEGGLVYGRAGDATSQYIGYLVILSLLSTGAGLFVASRWP